MPGLIGFHESWGSYWVNNRLRVFIKRTGLNQTKVRTFWYFTPKKLELHSCERLTLPSEGFWPVYFGPPFDCVFTFVGHPQSPVAHRSRSIQPTDSVRYQLAPSVGKRLFCSFLFRDKRLMVRTRSRATSPGHQGSKDFKQPSSRSPICIDHADIICPTYAIYGCCNGGVDSPKPRVKNGD